MKKIFLIIFLGILVVSPLISLAGGLVPCGGCEEFDKTTGECLKPQPPCQLCHFFVMFDRILDLVLIQIVPPLAVVMLVAGAMMFILGGGSPGTIKTAKDLMTAVAIGLILIYAAWLIVGLFLQVIGLSDWTKEIYRNWWEKGFFEIPCP